MTCFDDFHTILTLVMSLIIFNMLKVVAIQFAFVEPSLL